MGIGEFDTDHRRQSFTDILALQGELLLLKEFVLLPVGIEDTGKRGFKSLQMRSAARGVNGVGETKKILVIPFVVLEGNLHQIVLFSFVGGLELLLDINRLSGKTSLATVLVKVLNKFRHPTLIMEGLIPARTLIGQADPHPTVQKGHFTETCGQEIEGKLIGLEEGEIGTESLLSATQMSWADHLHIPYGDTRLKPLMIMGAIPEDIDIKKLGEGIDHRDPYAMQATRSLIGLPIKLSASMKNRKHYLKGGFFRIGGVTINRNSTPVVRYGNAVVKVDGHIDLITVARDGLIHTVVDHFEHQVVQTLSPGLANIHTRSHSDCIEPLQNNDTVRPIFVYRGRHTLLHAHLSHHFVSTIGIESAGF